MPPLNLDDTASRRPAEELVELRARWKRDRARLHDRLLRLPTLPAVLEDVRRLLESRHSVWVMSFYFGEHGEIEQVWGGSAYDDFLVDFVGRFKVLQEEGVLPRGVLCLPGVLADELLLFVEEEGEGFDERAIEAKAQEIDQWIDRVVARRAHAGGRFRSRVGVARLLHDPRIRPERTVYRALKDTLHDAEQRTQGATSRGAEALKGLLASRELDVLFQPIFDLSNAEVLGVEALTRGRAGTGLDEGESLFSLAESVGLLLPLERLCRDRTFEELRRLPPGYTLFLNLSPVGAANPDFLDSTFAQAVREAGFEPERVVIEITERNFTAYPDLFRAVLSSLRKRGFFVAIDDMGSGYSNLSLLAEMAPDYLKFDHLFVRNIHEHQVRRDLLDALLSFAERTGKKVIAEGIEKPEELLVLRQMGVPYGQGYYLARPMPVTGLAQFTYRAAPAKVALPAEAMPTRPAGEEGPPAPARRGPRRRRRGH